MEIRIYNQSLDFLGLIENQSSFIWQRKYADVGTFELHVPITNQTVSLLTRGNLVTYQGAGDAGIIEELEFSDNSVLREISVKGRFLSAYMDTRVIVGTVNFNGYVEVAMRQLLSSVTSLPHVQLDSLHGFTEDVDFQATYKNLLTVEKNLALSAGFGFNFVPDFTNKTITFNIYKGVDRSKSQQDRAYVEFSENFDNINSALFYENDSLLRNVGYVGGEGEGENRVFVTIGDTATTGYNRREVFIDARDIRSDGLTDAQYKKVLKQRGKEKMEDWILAQSFECTTGANLNFKYKIDYDLGDIVTIGKESWSIEQDLRITEITEVYENGTLQVTPTFGDTVPVTINWEES